ncbi:hypothetical protein H257_11293 [Aphanomyces astaci]|uniref:Uncharacterized protein n=1 Tax=Aphanomyces astaci TaxID=112090 RepID=W4G4V7_APHAT|nr:hypothetical protein H257_11293 [Aphanomyces astaci]ETV73978.1 hypothetical protein H257_11293 [Aphanomyces astaci]|eukprot:XP_009836491.1 hypothetical protein H257_11293 [Aphanomyces astaci]
MSRKQDDDHAEGFHGVDVDTLRGFLAIDSDAHEIIEELRWQKIRCPYTPRRILLRVRSPSLGRIGEDDSGGDSSGEREAS